MASGYSKQEILEKLQDASGDMATFYQIPAINYRGRTVDTRELYSEVIADWCCNNISLFRMMPAITRESSYKTPSHDGIPKNADSNREEELIAMAMFRQGEISSLGKILDYQTPLKNKRTDKAGKIDLLSYDGTMLRILELKEPDSSETILRCVLEGFTYLQTVDKKKLLEDFNLPATTVVKASPFVFSGGVQGKEFNEDRPALKNLMQLMDSKPFFISQLADGTYNVEG